MAQGRLFARFAYLNGRTRLVEHRQSAPLKIARTFELDGGGLEVCIMDASPGILAGDHYLFEWIIERGAQVRVTTQGATRVHPSTGPLSRQSFFIRVDEGARLEYWPEATIPFANANFISSLQAEVADGSQLILFECLASGRVARSEKFAFDEVTLETHIRDSSGLKLFTRNRFSPQHNSPAAPCAWGEWTHWGTLNFFGGEQPSLKEVAPLLESKGNIYGGVSTLPCGNLSVALLGKRAHDLRCVALEIEKICHSVSRETL